MSTQSKDRGSCVQLSQNVSIIAEAGVNHNGDIGLARELIDAAADAGADIVKFQTFRADALVTTTAPKAVYQAVNTSESETQHEMLRRLELSLDDHRTLLEHCAKRNIAFLSSPFDLESLAFLSAELKLSTIKLGSGELTNAPLLLEAAKSNCTLILSTGMANLGDIEQALAVLAFGMATPSETPTADALASCLRTEVAWSALRDRVTLLHCTTQYPAPIDATNLRAMITLRDAFGLRVGYSDHTEGNSMGIAAVALGACVIEKHITLDKSLAGPDHRASANPLEFRALVEGVREVERGLGNGIKQAARTEVANRLVARKSLRAARAIHVGSSISPEDVLIARPGDGQSPMRYWDLLGQKAKRDFAPGDLLELEE